MEKKNINIIYITTSCSKNKFIELQKKGINRDVPQAQKYHRLLIDGIGENINNELNIISAYPTNRKWSKKIFFASETEYINNLRYKYVSFFNIPLVRQIGIYFATIKEIRQKIKKDSVIVCDIWNQTFSKAARKMAKKYNVPVVGIVTDVPGYRSDAYKDNRLSIKQIISDWVEKNSVINMSKFDGYLLLTKDMEKVVNPLNKPSIILEGHADEQMASIKKFPPKNNPKIVMYAGTIHREYAIPEMVDAFLKGNYLDWELHIYGKGNYSDELSVIAQENKNIVYHGLIPNNEIVEAQLKACLIINPRPVKGEYVKYSFPSKTLEAMASGTPLLTTKLPGIPKDYYPYIYLFEDDSEAAFISGFEETLKISEKDLQNKGKKAREFAMNNKNNIVQAAHFCLFLQKLIKG